VGLSADDCEIEARLNQSFEIGSILAEVFAENRPIKITHFTPHISTLFSIFSLEFMRFHYILTDNKHCFCGAVKANSMDT
jgi:uncharacterized membrane protein YfbV (UPF0208 family)